MKISILVPAFNEEKMLGQSLPAIKSSASAFEERAWDWELIVCDNNSTDRTAELARSLGATVVFEPVNQISRARNRGAAAATGDWLLFIDADSFPHPALFAQLAGRIESGRCAGGGCLVRLDERGFPLGIALHLWNFLSRINRWAAGSFVFCKAEFFRELGGFSERVYASEELDFSIRLKALARARGLSVEIITRERQLTSARKIHLYSAAEQLRFFFRLLVSRRRVLEDREQCLLWYDGRR